jgi:hypothetical protein
MSLTAAISTLAVFSLQRFRAIVFTMKRKISRKASIIYIIIIWSFSIIVAMPTFMYRKQYTRLWKNHIEIWYFFLIIKILNPCSESTCGRNDRWESLKSNYSVRSMNFINFMDHTKFALKNKNPPK